MNHCPIKILSVFIISVFLISTITVISSPTLTTENNLSVQKGSQNISITSTLSGRNNNITNTKPQQLLGNTNQMKLDPAVATNYDNSLSSSNKLPNLQSEQLTNPLFNNFMYQNKFASTGVQTLTPPGEPLQTTCIQTITSIKQWNTLTQNDETGLQSIKTLYPSDLLVKVDTNNNVEFVVKMKDMSQVSSLNLLFSTYNIRIEDQVSSLASLVVWVPLRNLNVFLQQTAITTNIAFVEPNSYVHVQYVPNDPYWSEQYAPQLKGMPTAWDQALCSRSIKVAVIDTGIDYTHPDLVNNYLPIGYNWLANNSNPMDDNGHGTHVAGTIAAAINNGIGIA